MDMGATLENAIVGDILYAVWTWDDTCIPHFYRVVSKAAKSLVVQEVPCQVVSGSLLSGEVVAGEGSVGGQFRVRVNRWGWLDARLDRRGSPMLLWNGYPIRSSRM